MLQIGQSIAIGAGVKIQQNVGHESFDMYTVGPASRSLNSQRTGFVKGSKWTVAPAALGIQAHETFEWFNTGNIAVPGELGDETSGFDNGTLVRMGAFGIIGREHFDYASGAELEPLNAGIGWDLAWTKSW